MRSCASASGPRIIPTTTGAVGLIGQALQGAGIELAFAEMKGPVKDKLKRFGREAFFPTVDEAMRAYRAAAAGTTSGKAR